MHGACKCNVGYSGDCCEYTENTKKDTDTNTGSIKIKVAISVPGVVVLFVIIFCVCWRYFKE